MIGVLAGGVANAQSVLVGHTAVTVIEGGSVTTTRSVPGRTATTSVRLSALPSGAVTVSIASNDPAVTVAPTPLNFSTTNWNTQQTITITAVNDLNGFSEMPTVTLTPSGGGVSGSASITVTVNDKDTRRVNISPAGTTLSLMEGAESTFDVTLNTQPTGLVTVTQSVSNTVSASLTPQALTFTMSSWGTAQTVTARALSDTNTASETINLNFNPAGSDYDDQTAAATVTVVLTTTDTDSPAVTASTTTLQVTEGASATYTLRLATEPTGTVTLTQSTSDSTAGTITPPSLTFSTSTWSTVQMVTVTAEEDDDASSETVTFTHQGSGADYTTVSRTVQMTTLDNDTPSIEIDIDLNAPGINTGTLSLNEQGPAREYSVQLATQPTTSVTVAVTSGDSTALAVSTNSLTFSMSTWGTAQTVTVTAPNDINGVDETVTITHAATGGDYQGEMRALTAQVTDNDTPRVLVTPPASLIEGGSATSTVFLATPPTGPVEVAITVDNDDVTIDAPTTLTFDSTTWGTAQTFTVRAGEDDDGETELVTLTLDPDGASYSTLPSATSTFNLVDNDTRGVVLSTTSTLMVQEASSANYTVRLATQPAQGEGNVTVTVTVSDASRGITARPTTLVFTSGNWDTARTVTVRAVNDLNSVDETVTLDHTTMGADYDGPDVMTASLTVMAEDDDPPRLNVTPTILALNEGEDETYTVQLNTLPTGNVTVTISGATASITTMPTSLTFSTSTWSTLQTVTVTAETDQDGADAAATLMHAASGAPGYSGLAAERRPSVAVTVDDSDTPGITIDADPTTVGIQGGPLVVAEAASKEYTVRLATQPVGGDVTMTATSDNVALALDSDSSPQTRSLTFTSGTWNTAQTVTATAAADDDGGDEIVTIAHVATVASGNDYQGMMQSLAARVDDDDPREVMVTSPTSLTEGSTAASTVRLTTQPTGMVTVTITDNVASVTIDDTDSVTPGIQNTLMFTMSNWSTAQTVTIRAGDDDDGQGGQLTLTLKPRGSDYDRAPSAISTINLVDTDIRGVTLSTTTLEVLEQDSANYTVRLATQPVGGNVTVTVDGAANGITTNPTRLIFTDSTWDTAQTVIVSAASDSNSASETATLTHSVMGGDYGPETASLTVTTIDSETPSLRVAPGDLALTEGGRSGAYTVRLNVEPTSPVTVAVGVTGGGVTATPTPLMFTTSTWNVAQTVTVRAVADDDAMNEAATLTHTLTGASEYAGLSGMAVPSVDVTVDDPDTQGIVIDGATARSVNENGSLAYFVKLATQPVGGDVTVTVSSDDPALAVDTDASPQTRLLTFSAFTWDTAQVVNATGVDDGDPNHATVTISYAATGGDYDNVTTSRTLRVLDDDTRAVVIVEHAGSLNEGTATTSQVRLATQPTAAVTVVIRDNHPDVTVDAPAELTFDRSTWNTPQIFTIRAGVDDDAADETATLTLTPRGSDYNRVPSVMSTVNLVDTDTRGVTLSTLTLLVQEGNSASYAAKLDTRPVGGSVIVTVGGAANGITASPRALTFTSTNWDTQQTVTVRAAEDADTAVATATLTHTVSGAGYGRAGVTAANVMVTATDNEAAGIQVAPAELTLNEGEDGTYAVRLNSAPTGPVTVAVSGTITGSITASSTSLTFSSSTWNVAQMVTVSALTDDDGTNEATTLAHAVTGAGDYASLTLEARPGVSVMVDDSDTQNILIDADPSTSDLDAGPLTLNELSGHADNVKNYTVRLSTLPTAQVEVLIESGDRAVSVDGSPTPRMRTLTFSTLNWNTAQTVTATAVPDDDASAEAVTISHKASGGDYDGLLATLTATTVDSDTPALLLATSTLVASGVTEGGTQVYTVRLVTQPTGPVTVTAMATAIGAGLGRVEVDMDGDQAGRQRSLRFNTMNWYVPRTVTVHGVEDDDAADGTATLGHTARGADYAGVAAADTTFTVTDNDTPAVLLGATALALNEGSTATYTVRLETRPVGGTATVTAMSSTEAATVTPAMLQFGASDWNVPKTIRVRGAQEGSATITHLASGADYDGAATTMVAVDVRDTQVAGVRIEPPTLALREGGRGTYTVRLNTAPAGNVIVTATSTSPELTIDRDATPLAKQLTFTSNNWHVQQTVTASALADDGVDDEAATVAHSVAGYAGVTSVPNMEVTVDDDDVPGLLFEPAGGIQLDEPSSGTYTARLRFAPSAPVTVTISSDDAGVVVDTDDGTADDQSMLTFNAMNWSTSQTVTVRADLDNDAASEMAMLLHMAAGTGSGYDGVSATYEVRVSDANAAPAPANVVISAAGPTSLTVRWTPSRGAQEHVVQWRLAGQEWSTERQLTLPGRASTAQIEGLNVGVEYEVRVLGVNEGDLGDPSLVARAMPASLGPGPGAPVAGAELGNVTLAIGATRVIDLRVAFRDPDGDALTYTTLSLDESVVEATVSDTELRLRAVRTGVAEVYVWATDPGDLRGSQTLLVTVTGRRPLLTASDAQAPEGGTARLLVQLSSVRARPTRIAWSMVLDTNVATANANAADLVAMSGEVTIPAGETQTQLEIAIADDEEIEPAREWFEVSLSPLDNCCRTAARRSRVVVLEGVCDRTPAVRDALRASALCETPTPATLAAMQRLEVIGAGSLQAGDFADLAGLRTLLLERNELRTLPDGLFAGLDSLRELSLENNPGAPFELAVELARTDADPRAPGPATVQARFALGAPFALQADLSAEPMAAALPDTVAIGAGAVSGTSFTVAAMPSLRLLAEPAALPSTRCRGVPCFRGIVAVAGEALVLYRRPPQVQPVPPLEPLENNDPLQLALTSLIRPGDSDPGGSPWRASSSDESVATARVVGDNLVVTPEAGSEGTVEIVLQYTDEAGFTATLRFEVQVEFYWPGRQVSGWRAGALIEAAEQQ